MKLIDQLGTKLDELIARFIKWLTSPSPSPDPEDTVPVPRRRRRGLGLASWLILSWIVLLDVIRIYFQDYTAFDRLKAWQSLFLGGQPALIFWVVWLTDLVRLGLCGRLLMAVTPSSAPRIRWLTVLLGLPLVAVTVTGLDFAFSSLLEHLARSPDRTRALVIFCALGILTGCAVAFFIELGLSEGSQKIKSRGLVFLQVLPLAALLGVPVFLLRHLSFFLLSLPMLGAVLTAAFNIILALWFFRRAAARTARELRLRGPHRPGIGFASASGLFVILLLGLGVVIPGPPHHLDAIGPPPLCPRDTRVLPSYYNDLGERIEVSSTRLTLLIDKDPFHFRIGEPNSNSTLLELARSAGRSPDYRGASQSLELRGLTMVPFLSPARLLATRLRLSSTPLPKVDNVQSAAGVIVAETRSWSHPMAIAFTFYDEDIIKITVDAGSKSPWQTTAIAFACDPNEHFLGAGSGLSGLDLRGRDLEYLAAAPVLVTKDFPLAKLFELAPLAGNEGFSAWPVPFVYLSRGVGIFLAETIDPRLELASKYPDAIRFSGRGGPLTLYVITGPSPLDVIKKFSALMAPKAKAPAEALLPWAAISSAELCAGGTPTEMSALRRFAIPAEYVYPARQDDDDEGAASPLCPGAEKALAAGRALGFKFAFSDFAWLGERDREYPEAVHNGYLVMNRLGLPYHFLTPGGARVMIDFTNPAAVKWRAAHWAALAKAGFTGAVLSPHVLLPPDAVLYNGASGSEARNVFPLIYAKAVRDYLGPEAPIASRIGFAGMERLVSLTWPAPPSSGPPGAAAEASGLALSSLGGQPLPGPPAVRAFAGGLQAPGRLLRELGLAGYSGLFLLPPGFGKLPAGDPPDTVKAIRTFAEIRARLFPYLYSLAAESSRGGLPLLLPPPLLDPGQDSLYRAPAQFLLGPGLLVAPSAPGSSPVKVSFPPGHWVNLETLAWFGQGEAWVTPQGGPLMFLGEGQILPIFVKSWPTFAGREQNGLRPGSLDQEIILIWLAGPAADFTLFDGTEIKTLWGTERIWLSFAGGKPRTYTWRLLYCPPPVSVAVNGIELPAARWRFQDNSGVLTISGLRGPEANVEIILQEVELP